MNFQHKYELYAFITHIINKLKVQVDLFFYKFGLNILIWEISLSL